VTRCKFFIVSSKHTKLKPR